MNPINSFKKWLLTSLIPLIEKKGDRRANVEDLLKDELVENTEPPKSGNPEGYSDLLENSEYPEESK